MKESMAPPKAPQLLLRLILPADLLQSVAGDLEEEMNAKSGSGPISARLWYWRQATAITCHFARGAMKPSQSGLPAGNASALSGSRAGPPRSPGRLTHGLGQDLRFAFRQLGKSPGFTIVAILALALGIAASSTIFSAVNAVLLRPLPYKDSDRLVLFKAHALPQVPDLGVSGPELMDFREQATLFDEMAAYTWGSVNLTQDGEPEELQAGIISANFLRTFGVEPAAGTTLLPDADKGDYRKAVILSYGLWQRRFGGDRNTLGKSILLDGQSYDVVGILPSSFQVLQTTATSPNRVDIWIPQPRPYAELGRFDHGLQVIARIRAGISVPQAQSELTAMANRVNAKYYSAFAIDYGVELVAMYGEVVRRARPALLVLLGAVAFVLLIACVNVANLLLAKAVAREREIAIRAALGASRWRIVRQLLAESMVLGLGGGAAGFALTIVGLRTLIAIAPENMPRLAEISPDLQVLLFTVSIALVTGIGFGLVPAIQTSRPDVNEALKNGENGKRGLTGRIGGHFLRRGLVISEVALALMLLIGAGLMIRSFLRLQDVNPGFDPRNLLTAELTVPGTKYSDPQTAVFYHQVLERIGGLSGVEGAGAVSILPLSGSDSSTVILIEGARKTNGVSNFQSQYRTVTTEYFSTMKIALVAGRYFTNQDGADTQKVAIINEGCAKRFWPGENPLGKRINLASDAHSGKPWATIVGIVGETKDAGLDTRDSVQVLLPDAQRPVRKMTLVVRTTGDPIRIAAGLRGAVWSIDPDQPIAEIRAMDQVLYFSVAQPRFNMVMLGLMAALAAVLASIGIYGLMSYSVSQRVREIGIRMALGASGTVVARMVLGQALVPVAIGIVVGLMGAFATTRLMRALLFGITATDEATFVIVPFLIVAVAMMASYIPVRRATKIGPLAATRHE